MNKDFLYVDTEQELTRACARLQACPWLAVDTEFERTRTYYPELCLLQIADREAVYIIDPLACDPGPVFDLLYKPSITKVFHSARQDLEIFQHLRGHVPAPVYDTQLAAALAGYDKHLGYASLVSQMLGITLDKGQTRTDWKRRPLAQAQLRYAADDVIYLAAVYELLVKKLAGHPRLDSLQIEFAQLQDPALYVPDPAGMWRKIHDARLFSGNALAVLKELAAWREVTARTENLPRKWLIADDAIVNIARVLPQTYLELSGIKGLEPPFLQRHGQALLKLVLKHCNNPEPLS